MATVNFLCGSLLICSLFVSGQALAGGYRGELYAGYTKENYDYGGFFSEETLTQSIAGTYYFTPVDVQNKPLAEAAFLGQNSYVNLGYSSYRSSWSESGLVYDGDSSSVNALVYVPKTLLLLGYGDSYSDGEHFSTYLFGLAPIKGLLVYTYYWHEGDSKSRTNLVAEYVKQLADEHAVRINFSYTDAPDGYKDMYGVSADYYFNRYWSAGFSLGKDDATAYGVKTRYFINDQWSLFAGFDYIERGEGLELRIVSKSFGLGVSLRL